jgi:hypothetical protein
MAHYFVDNRPQSDGAHAVHAKGCKHMASDKQYLGEYFSLLHAIMEARKSFWATSDCSHCGRGATSVANLEDTVIRAVG